MKLFYIYTRLILTTPLTDLDKGLFVLGKITSIVVGVGSCKAPKTLVEIN